MNFSIPSEFIEPVVCEGINLTPIQYFALVLFAALGVASIIGFIVDYFMRRRAGKIL